jgi:hypothetical protein
MLNGRRSSSNTDVRQLKHYFKTFAAVNTNIKNTKHRQFQESLTWKKIGSEFRLTEERLYRIDISSLYWLATRFALLFE